MIYEFRLVRPKENRMLTQSSLPSDESALFYAIGISVGAGVKMKKFKIEYYKVSDDGKKELIGKVGTC